VNDITIHLSQETKEILLKLIEAIGKGGKKMFNPDGPATEGQVKYLDSLLNGKDDMRRTITEKHGVAYTADLTKAQASTWIEYLKKKTEKKPAEAPSRPTVDTNQLPF